MPGAWPVEPKTLTLSKSSNNPLGTPCIRKLCHAIDVFDKVSVIGPSSAFPRIKECARFCSVAHGLAGRAYVLIEPHLLLILLQAHHALLGRAAARAPNVLNRDGFFEAHIKAPQ